MTDSRAEREARLKAALRANLRKRKQQERGVPEPGAVDDDSGTGPEGSAPAER